jgi:hypothetical protein
MPSGGFVSVTLLTMVLPKSTGGDVAVPFPADVVGFRPIIPVPGWLAVSVFCNILIGFSLLRFLDLLEQHLLLGIHIF